MTDFGGSIAFKKLNAIGLCATGAVRIMKKFLLSLFLLSSAALAEPSCNTQRGMTAIDISQPVTTITTKSGKTGLEAFKVIGVKTIARYYDWPEAGTISCRVLLPQESDAILGAKLSIVSVFQNQNDDPETFFNAARGAVDARQAVKIAKANGQPAGSAIYFAVDGVDQAIKDLVFEYSVNRGKAIKKGRKQRLLKADGSFRKHIRLYERFRHYYRNIFHKDAANIKASDMLPFIENYFRAARGELAVSKSGYKIGGYGSGATCARLQSKGLIDYCWLAMSTGWPGYQKQLTSGKWHLAQQRSTKCSAWQYPSGERVRFDFNRVNKSDYGQWSKKGDVVLMPNLPKSCISTF
jgi:predicted small secreted protein